MLFQSYFDRSKCSFIQYFICIIFRHVENYLLLFQIWNCFCKVKPNYNVFRRFLLNLLFINHHSYSNYFSNTPTLSSKTLETRIWLYWNSFILKNNLVQLKSSSWPLLLYYLQIMLRLTLYKMNNILHIAWFSQLYVKLSLYSKG